jgi:O-antigen ligase
MMIFKNILLGLHKTLFYLLLLFLPTQPGLHFWPEWAMVLGRRMDYLSPTLYLTDILIVSLLLCWFVEAISRVTGYACLPARQGLRVLQEKKIGFFILIFLFILINIYFAVSRPVAIYTWIKVLEFVLLGIYIIKTKPQFNRIVFFLSLSVLYSSLIAISQFLLQHSIGGVFWFLGERTFNSFTPGIAQIPLCLPWVSGCPLFLRPYGTFPHPNVLGGYIAVLLPLIISNFQFPISKQTKKISIFKIGTIVLALLALVLTFSRSAWAVGILGIGIWYLVFRLKKKIIFPNIPYTKTQIPVFLFIISLGISIIVPQFLGDSEPVVVRKQLNESAISIITHSPVSGVGLGNFLVALPGALPSRMIYFLQPVHNIYLLIISEVGLVGSIIIGWLFWKAFRNVTRDMRHVTSQKNNILRITCYVSLVTLLMLGFADHYPLTLQQGRLLLTLLVSLFIIV